MVGPIRCPPTGTKDGPAGIAHLAFSPPGRLKSVIKPESTEDHSTLESHRPTDPRLKAESQDLRTVARTAIVRNGWQGERVDLDLIYRGQNQHFIGLIIIRGLYEYQTFIRVSKTSRTITDAHPSVARHSGADQVIRLTEAQDRRTSEPDSWNARASVSNALHRAGHPVEAMREWSQLSHRCP